jgi:hypothetical protein
VAIAGEHVMDDITMGCRADASNEKWEIKYKKK